MCWDTAGPVMCRAAAAAAMDPCSATAANTRSLSQDNM
jgi:hypothetical protein